MMWVVILAILIVLAVCMAFWRFIWAILKPIFVFIYQSIVNALRRSGMSEQAAKAIISVGIIVIILLILFGSC